MEGQQSEVRRILAQIACEYESARNGLTGLSCGSTQHSFITARMEHMGRLQIELEKLVGKGAGIALVVQTLESLPDSASGATPG